MKTALCLIGLIAALTLYHPVQVKAQEPTDTTTIVKAVTPIFSGDEQTLTDTLLAYGQAATDPEFKGVVIDAVNVIKDTPKEGGISEWLAYIFGVVGAIFGVYQYITKRKNANPPNPVRPV